MGLDWLEGTWPDVPETWRRLRELLGDMVRRERGFPGGWYDCSAYVLDRGLVGWCGDSERAARQGVHVQLQGQACALLGPERLLELARFLDEAGKATRVDWCMDDRSGELSAARFDAAATEGRVVSRGAVRATVGYSATGAGFAGYTLAVGQRGSDFFLRAYDKAAERGVEGPWFRVEVEARGRLVGPLLRDWLARGAVAVVEQVNRRVRVVVATGADSNRRRWAVAGWWARFLGTVERGRSLVAGVVEQLSVERAAEWVERQAGPWLAAITRAEGGDLGWLLGVLGRSEVRLKAGHLAAIAAAG